jgi:hypothetical protein
MVQVYELWVLFSSWCSAYPFPLANDFSIFATFESLKATWESITTKIWGLKPILCNPVSSRLSGTWTKSRAPEWSIVVMAVFMIRVDCFVWIDGVSLGRFYCQLPTELVGTCGRCAIWELLVSEREKRYVANTICSRLRIGVGCWLQGLTGEEWISSRPEHGPSLLMWPYCGALSSVNGCPDCIVSLACLRSFCTFLRDACAVQTQATR